MKKHLLLFFALTMCCTVKLFPQGTISARSFTSSSLSRTMTYNVYLPPSYNQNTTTTYPVLYLFHGLGGRYYDWANNGAASMLNTEIANGAKEMIVIMPDGIDSWYNNTKVQWESYFYNELIPSVQSTFRAGTTKQTRAVAGLSMGGWGTTYYWIKYASMYSSAYSMSGAFTTEGGISLETLINNLSTTQRQALPPYTMEIGTSDQLYSVNVTWHNFLNTSGITYTYITRAGIHDWAFWKVCFPKAVRFASTNFGATTTVPVTGVTVSPTSATVGINGTSQLTATVAPTNATNKAVTWTSGNTAIATVSTTGLVTGKTAGTATITVTTTDQSKTATCAITVTSTTVPVTGVTMSPTTVSIAAGATSQLTATIAPTNATNKSVTWSSGNTTIATVSSTGLVTGIAAGSATITVTTADGAKTATCAVTVTASTATYYSIKNRWKGTFLYDAGANVGYGTTVVNNNYLWQKVAVTTTFFLLKNLGTGEYMNIEGQTGSVQCNAGNTSWYSQMWSQEAVDATWSIIRNRWQTASIIHVEGQTGSAQYSGASNGWYSAQWQLSVTAPKSSMGIENEDEPSVIVYPNPVENGLVSIQLKSDENAIINLFDMQGRNVFESKLSGSENTLDVSSVYSGIYFVKVSANSGTYIQKLVIK